MFMFMFTSIYIVSQEKKSLYVFIYLANKADADSKELKRSMEEETVERHNTCLFIIQQPG